MDPTKIATISSQIRQARGGSRHRTSGVLDRLAPAPSSGHVAACPPSVHPRPRALWLLRHGLSSHAPRARESRRARSGEAHRDRVDGKVNLDGGRGIRVRAVGGQAALGLRRAHLGRMPCARVAPAVRRREHLGRAAGPGRPPSASYAFCASIRSLRLSASRRATVRCWGDAGALRSR